MAASYKEIFENNKQWVGKMKGKHGDDYFTELAKGQDPHYLYIGCADSRAPINSITELDPNELFVHRNVANVVCNTDVNAISCITYAVKYLKVKHIIICGHTACGGVKAAMGTGDLGVINPWVRNIRDVYRLHEAELDGIKDEDKRYDRLVELNVEEQCFNLMKIAAVQEAFTEGSLLSVHGWVFNIAEGLLEDQNIDYNAMYQKALKLYNETDATMNA